MDMKLPTVVRHPRMLVQSFSQIVGYQISKHNIPDLWLDAQGEGITIAVLDTGCQTDHIDLNGSVLSTYNTTGGDINDVHDQDGHGSHVTGIITANNNELGIVGVAPKAKVISVKVLGDNGSGAYQWISRGIEEAIARNVDIISMSLGGPSDDPQLHAAIQRAYQNNIPIICAAGNAGDIHNLDYPGRYTETISIGALNADNIRAEFSQTGRNLDFMAPGVDILSTVPVNSYAVFSGTSMATPWVSGVVALMLSKHHCKGGDTPVNTVEDVRDHLRKTAIDLQDAGRDPNTGFGLIDVGQSVKLMKTADNMPEHIAQTTRSTYPHSQMERWYCDLEKRISILEKKRDQTS